jgi:hypothetical protein
MEGRDERELEILRDVVTLHPSMASTASCVALFEDEFQYPIASSDRLLEVFRTLSRGGPFLRIRGCRISERQIRRDIPEQVYPIRSRSELIGALLVAFELNQMIQRGFVKAGEPRKAWTSRSGGEGAP